jgi:hypothetical protein
MNETSNLLEYSAAQLSLLIDAIQMKIKDEESTRAVRQIMANGEDLSDLLVEINNEGIQKSNQILDDLYGLRVAMLNAWTIVNKTDRMCNN